ncbi:MAG: ribonuclease Y [Dehalococcoidia bacterium]|nr:ribonuclease Y [Dehalococcoidia bacterium]MCA9850262.1 ribonuclease Y [Dehalococcoidia bacterium]MCB9483016.1 ribonuclease Y [Dehalococcoidia bacterium]MCB9491720.1 ribonuclease Y [Dehalococcoidia bacterium]
MDALILVAEGAVAFLLGAGLVYFVTRQGANSMTRQARDEARIMVEEAENRARKVELDANQTLLARREELEAEIKERRNELSRAERRLEQREETLERRAENLERSEQSVRDRTVNLEKTEAEIDQIRAEARSELERVASLTLEEAREQLLQNLDGELREESNRRVRAMESSARNEADVRARKILATVMQRITSEVTAETTVTVVPIPSDELKGRIIGREGRNIRAFESATGCDLIIDDTPEVVTVSGFDPVRREIARTALARLIQDGRIQPTRIEDAVDKARAEVDKLIEQAGQQALVDAEVTNLHPEIVRTLGRLRYRYSYGQNQLRHCIETSWLAAALAHEIGANVEIARLGGLLHDLGKAVDREMEGTHARLGADIARRFGVPREVVHCVEAHHEEVPPETVEALVVICADAMSGSRPGARRESAEEYIKRLEALEAIANSFDGVDQSFAVQAGREVRIIVKPERVDDLGASRLARDVSKKIEETMQYPGEIKVTVVRETRASAVAH